MAWFREVFGFEEHCSARPGADSFAKGSRAGSGDSTTLVAKATGVEHPVGAFECLTPVELRGLVAGAAPVGLGLGGGGCGGGSAAAGGDGSEGWVEVAPSPGATFENIAGDVKELHRAPKFAGSVFQVASQFNCLEMVSPDRRPEDGITCYAFDRTQGPACALACPAGTLFRNYFVGGGVGQVGHHQINTLAGVEAVVDNDHRAYWTMQNGYCLPTAPGKMAAVSERLALEPKLLSRVKDALQVGIHWGTSVHGAEHRVCQVFCSAVPIAYVRNTRVEEWAPFAQAILDSAYDCTLLAGAALARKEGRRVTVLLTKLGAGAFGNREEWVRAAIQSALHKHRNEPLDVKLVHYGHIERFYSSISLSALAC